MNNRPPSSVDPIPLTATTGLVLTNPEFELVRMTRQDATIYVYAINRRLYSVSTLDQVDSGDNEVNWNNLWPNPVTLYSHPIIVVTSNGWGLYQTRGGILDEIIPVDHSSPLRLIQAMTIPHTDEPIRPYLASELVSFDRHAQNRLESLISQQQSLGSDPISIYNLDLSRQRRQNLAQIRSAVQITPPSFSGELDLRLGLDQSEAIFIVAGLPYRANNLILKTEPFNSFEYQANLWPESTRFWSHPVIVVTSERTSLVYTQNGRLIEATPNSLEAPIQRVIRVRIPAIRTDPQYRPHNYPAYPNLPPFEETIWASLERAALIGQSLTWVHEGPSRTIFLTNAMRFMDLTDYRIHHRESHHENIPENSSVRLPDPALSQTDQSPELPRPTSLLSPAQETIPIDLPTILYQEWWEDHDRTVPDQENDPGQIVPEDRPIWRSFSPFLPREDSSFLPREDSSSDHEFDGPGHLRDRSPFRLGHNNKPMFPSFNEQVLETLIKQLYHLPVDLPSTLPLPGLGVHGNVISYERAAEMLRTDQITKFSIDPLLQPWAGPPSDSPECNRIITLSGRNGTSYLVKAQYILKDNQMYPPTLD